jgi:hypothetical protein
MGAMVGKLGEAGGVLGYRLPELRKLPGNGAAEGRLKLFALKIAPANMAAMQFVRFSAKRVFP